MNDRDNKGRFIKGMKSWNSGLKRGEHPSLSKTGFQERDKNPSWKGDKVKYTGVHVWIRRHYGAPVKCDFCGSFKNLRWANVSYEYKRDISDWMPLCHKCNLNHDRKNGWGKATKLIKKQRKRV